ncbi:1-acyl-sn-glycerol-3-phosphate acyltransferase delta [Pitangus sulphuratus]|nr:1-acyl-sn-glycerol-3-phosphate acyltransferase delta [Pitangus sulphuratus]
MHMAWATNKELEAIVWLESCDIIADTETRWDDLHNWNAVVDGYQIFRTNRQGRRGGRIALYVRECFDCLELDNGDERVMCFWVRSRGKPARQISCWESGTDHPTFDEEAEEMFYKQLGEVLHSVAFVLLGDFNLPDVCWKYNTAERKQSRRFLEYVKDKFLMELVKESTREEALLEQLLVVWTEGSLHGINLHFLMHFIVLNKLNLKVRGNSHILPNGKEQSSKVLAKKELSYMPIIGWMWYFLEIVFCKRKWEEDRKTVIQKLLSLRDYPENFWFLIHCEGTRFTEQKHQISMQVAEAKGLPKLKYHLLPRTKGFAVTVQCLRNVDAFSCGVSGIAAVKKALQSAVILLLHYFFYISSFSAVYDSTLNFRNNENPTLLGVLNGKKYHADLRIPLEEVPEDEQECSTWLHKLYQEKDAFQEEYYQTGTYPAVPIVPPHRPWTLLNWLFWALLLLYPLFKLLINMINSGSSLTLASFAFVIIIASSLMVGEDMSDLPSQDAISKYLDVEVWKHQMHLSWMVTLGTSVGVRWMIGVTEINKGSTYGNNENKQK